MIEIGRLCVKIAGRDSNKKCVIIDLLENNFVLIDGETRRKKCNIMHLEPLNQVLDIAKDTSHEEVIKAFEKIGLKAKVTRPKDKKEKPIQIRGKKKLAKQETKTAKKDKKKEEKKKAKDEKKKEKSENKTVKKELKAEDKETK